MALVPFTNPITAAQLNANFTDKLASMTTEARAGTKIHEVLFTLFGATSALAESRRVLLFTPPDDAVLDYFALTSRHASASGVTVSASLEVQGSNQDPLGGTPVALSTVQTSTTVSQRVQYGSPSGDRFVSLLKGVPYVVRIDPAASAIDNIAVALQYTLKRRTR